jgi:hypothetical protein
MLSGLRNRIRGLRLRASHYSEDVEPWSLRTAAATPLALNLGIDFGTSYTKVAFRDLNAEQTGLVLLGGIGLMEAMVPSVVSIEPMTVS